MNSVTLLMSIQHVAMTITLCGFILYLFRRRRRPSPIKAVHPILVGSLLAGAVFCGCLALRAGQEPEINLLRFWIASTGAVLAVLAVLLSYRSLWRLCVEVSTRPPWPMSSGTTPPAPPASPAKPQPTEPSAERIYPDHGLTS